MSILIEVSRGDAVEEADGWVRILDQISSTWLTEYDFICFTGKRAGIKSMTRDKHICNAIAIEVSRYGLSWMYATLIAHRE